MGEPDMGEEWMGDSGLRPRPGGAEPRGDQRPSYRMLLASALIRRGEDTGRIAAATGVPPALIDLLRERATPSAANSPDSSRTLTDAARRARQTRIRLMLTAQAAAITAITLSLTALHGGQSGVGLAGALLAALAITLCSVAARPTHRPTHRPTPPTSRS